MFHVKFVILRKYSNLSQFFVKYIYILSYYLYLDEKKHMKYRKLLY